MHPTTLLLPEKLDIEIEAVQNAWMQTGNPVQLLGKYWIKNDSLVTQPLAIYGNQAFAFVLAQLYNKTLLFPDDTIIARLDQRWTKRRITQTTLGALTEAMFPIFIKPVVPKMFIAGVLTSLAALQERTQGLELTEPVLTSSIISHIQAEARCFVLDGDVKDIACYEGEADLLTGRAFVTGFLQENAALFPRSVVIDVAYAEPIGWFILEFNASWGAGLNGCNAGLVLPCIAAATVNEVTDVL
ncbi:uncharacterized protein DUF4343 [Chitinophaga skermanii]|uniref:Uncharacterized protein DUF4343 n=1 Tax=Chitinophaga skermanii TaxID=331697 RepID=A0A327Q796_9BACT|nr:ATP-grasp domain-containing protein [Chitinophaga skermanii]RAI97706.1 uncharacterized protein DUF4343 [Chitinophaga skermanii]